MSFELFAISYLHQLIASINRIQKMSTIQDKSFAFALSIIGLYKQMLDQKEYVLSKQILRSGCSIGANVHEASAAQSDRDFLSKMSISSKEARETRYWLMLLDQSQLVELDYAPYLAQCDEVCRILTSIVKTVSEKISSNQVK